MDSRKFIEQMKKKTARRAYIDSSEDESPPPIHKKPKIEEEQVGIQFETVPSKRKGVVLWNNGMYMNF